MITKIVLIYLGEHQEKQEKVEQVLRKLEIPYLFLDDSDLGFTCGYLMKVEGFDSTQKKGHNHFSSDLMLMRDVEEEEITNINALLKTMDVVMERIAMLTEHNKYWYLCDLIQEVEKEHRYFKQVEEIKQMLTNSKDLIIDAYTKESWAIYVEAFMEAYAVISTQNTPEAVNEVYEKLLTAYASLQKK